MKVIFSKESIESQRKKQEEQRALQARRDQEDEERISNLPGIQGTNYGRRVIEVTITRVFEPFKSRDKWSNWANIERLTLQRLGFETEVPWDFHKTIKQNTENIQNEDCIFKGSPERNPPFDCWNQDEFVDVKSCIPVKYQSFSYKVNEKIQIGVTQEQKYACSSYIVVYAKFIGKETFYIQIYSCRYKK